jgi:hypothetical protein
MLNNAFIVRWTFVFYGHVRSLAGGAESRSKVLLDGRTDQYDIKGKIRQLTHWMRFRLGHASQSQSTVGGSRHAVPSPIAQRSSKVARVTAR